MKCVNSKKAAKEVTVSECKKITKPQIHSKKVATADNLVCYDYRSDIQTLHIEAEDLKLRIEELRFGAAAGASGQTNADLQTLIKGSHGEENLNGNTALVNIIIRGWLPDKDWLLLKRARVLPSIKATSRRTMIIGDQYALESQSLLCVTPMFSKKPGSN